MNKQTLFWIEFYEMWKENWFDGLSTFNKQRLKDLLKRYEIKPKEEIPNAN